MANDRTQRPELELLHGWAEAEEQPARPGALRVVPVTSVGRAIHLSTTPENWRGMVIPLRYGEVVTVPKEFRSSSRGALRAEVAQFSAGSESTEALHVWCRDPRCNDAFTSFAVFLLDRAQDDRGLGNLLAESHAEFERLLGAPESIDSPRLTGLVGELLVLLDGVQRDPGMVMYWAGPRGERHDFRNGSSAIEVKCSLRSETKERRVHISDWDQLEIPDGGGLHLHAIRLERVTGGDWSVPSLLAAIRARLGAAGMVALDGLLANYDRALTECAWEFSVKERDTYRVVEGFPRLVPGMLVTGKAPGVSKVSYTLDLDQGEPFRADWNVALDGFVRGKGNA